MLISYSKKASFHYNGEQCQQAKQAKQAGKPQTNTKVTAYGQ